MSIVEPGLHVIATPIGNLEDLSPRAIDVLRRVDLVLAEDTRTSGRLLKHFGIGTAMQALHEHNERQMIGGLIQRLQGGASLALISDAGTPLISDPGYHLVEQAHRVGIRVSPIPGPSAVTTALAVSGLATDRFVFEGFLPSKEQTRRRHLRNLQHESRTMVFFEAPHRIVSCVAEMCDVFGPGRMACICRELTKLYETVHRESLGGLKSWIAGDPNRSRGEMVLVVQGAEPIEKDEEELRDLVSVLLNYLTPSQAAAAAAELKGGKKNIFYRLALELKKDPSRS